MSDSSKANGPSDDAAFAERVNALAPKLLAEALGAKVGEAHLLDRDSTVLGLYALLYAAATCHCLLTEGADVNEADARYAQVVAETLRGAKERLSRHVIRLRADDSAGASMPAFFTGKPGEA